MIRRCEPLHEGDTHEHCGVVFDDEVRMAVCPHVLLAGGDTVGIVPTLSRQVTGQQIYAMKVPVPLVESGLLWLINTTVFHPRGFALGYALDTGDFTLFGDGSERLSYSEDPTEWPEGCSPDDRFLAVEHLFALRRAGLFDEYEARAEEADDV